MHLTIFDLDKTLLKVNISFKFYYYLYKKGLYKKHLIFYPIIIFFRFKYFNLSLKSLHKIFFKKFLKNKNYAEITRYIDAFLDKYLDKIFYLPAVKRLQKAINDKHYVVLLSSSPEFLVKPIADILKINNYKTTVYGVDGRGNFNKIQFIMDGRQKAICAKELLEKLNISNKEMTVYSDSIEDIDLFLLAGKKVAVRPCKKLSKISIDQAWEII